MLKILIINGPNLNMLGVREPKIYGEMSLNLLEDELKSYTKNKNIVLDFFQSNHEGEIIDKIHSAYDKIDIIIINAGALTHYSIAIHDALKSVAIPTIEVHLSNIYNREEFRQQSFIAPIAIGGIYGFGKDGYKLAIDAAIRYLDGKAGGLN
ncbi:MAG: type II 3-dehydroquinate dehydratase [Syntrophomonadaceae bacterium]|nr:type II 3-dehydroquinate dehydratase [Syntrophomonadaceae bacterium]